MFFGWVAMCSLYLTTTIIPEVLQLALTTKETLNDLSDVSIIEQPFCHFFRPSSDSKGQRHGNVVGIATGAFLFMAGYQKLADSGDGGDCRHGWRTMDMCGTDKSPRVAFVEP